MESRKMILKNLFTGQQRRNKNILMDMGREEERVRYMERVTWKFTFSSVQSLSRVLLCNPMNCSMPGLPVHHQLLKFTQTHVH